MGTINKKIFILHGWTYTTEKWNEVVSRLTTAGYEPILLLVPGLTEATDRVWSLDDYVQWLEGKLAAEQKPILIGHSNGGRIAIAFAARFPEKLGKLILVDSAGIYQRNWSIRLKRLAFGVAVKIGKKITKSETMRKVLYKLAGVSDYSRANPNMRQTMAKLIAIDLTSELPKIVIPTVIIWGRNDDNTPLSDGQTMHRYIKDSKLFVIDGAGHSPHFSHSQIVAEKIIAEIK